MPRPLRLPALSLIDRRPLPRRRKTDEGELLYTPEESPLVERAALWVPNVSAEIFAYFGKHPERLYEMPPRRFEELVAGIFENHWFDVELTKETRDGGWLHGLKILPK